tara:strand:+ start:275 stop:628 length:354 start_codon:yes stop_codon:yes gene_type:complete
MALSAANALKLEGAIASSNLIRISYSKKRQPNDTITQRILRVVEPYEIKDGYLYAWDTTKGKRTKSFITNNINSVLVLNTKFEDRYPDEGKAFPTYEANNPPDARKMRPAVNTTTFV